MDWTPTRPKTIAKYFESSRYVFSLPSPKMHRVIQGKSLPKERKHNTSHTTLPLSGSDVTAFNTQPKGIQAGA